MFTIRLRLLTLAAVILALSGMASTAGADEVDIYQWMFNIDGAVYDSFSTSLGATPVSGSLANGLGTLTWSTSDAGPHSFIGFFDCDLIVPEDDLFYWENEYGMAVGSPATGQSWEVDVSYDTLYYDTDIRDNVLAGALDNSVNNGFSPGDEPFDVAMALGWDFSLDAGESALVTMHLAEARPEDAGGLGFYLLQTDPYGLADPYSVYFYSTLEILDAGSPVVPEPATIVLTGLGLAGMAVFRRRSAIKSS